MVSLLLIIVIELAVVILLLAWIALGDHYVTFRREEDESQHDVGTRNKRRGSLPRS